jgi:replicative DNA helicase
MLKRKKKNPQKDIKIAESNNLLDLSTEVRDRKIDCLIIDGGYLLNEGNSNNIVENITTISRKLKTFSKKEDIPVIVTWQFAKSAEKDNNPSLSHFNWGYSISQNSDLAIGLQCKENMRAEKKRKVVLMKDREGELTEFIINFDLTNMDFSIDEEYTKIECNPEQENDIDF